MEQRASAEGARLRGLKGSNNDTQLYRSRLDAPFIVDTQQKTVKMIARGQIYGARFAPNGNDQVVYGRAAQQTLTSRVNVYRANADGTSTVALTHDGRSLFPLWGPGAIAYDRERLRREDAPVYETGAKAA